MSTNWREGFESSSPEKINTYMNPPPEGVNFVAYIGHGNYNGWMIGHDHWYGNYGGGGDLMFPVTLMA